MHEENTILRSKILWLQKFFNFAEYTKYKEDYEKET